MLCRREELGEERILIVRELFGQDLREAVIEWIDGAGV